MGSGVDQGAVTEAAFRADAAPGAGGGLQDSQVWSSPVAAEPLRSAQPRDATAHQQHPWAGRRHGLLRVLLRPVDLRLSAEAGGAGPEAGKKAGLCRKERVSVRGAGGGTRGGA